MSSNWVLPIPIRYGKFPFGLLAAETCLGLSPLSFTFGPSSFGFCLLGRPFGLLPLGFSSLASSFAFYPCGPLSFFPFWALRFYSIVGTSPLVLLVCYCACLCPRITPIRVTGCVGTMEGSGTCRDYIPLTPPPTNVRALLPATYY